MSLQHIKHVCLAASGKPGLQTLPMPAQDQRAVINELHDFNRPNKEGRVFLDVYRSVFVRFGKYFYYQSASRNDYTIRFIDDLLAVHAGLSECLVELGPNASREAKRAAFVRFLFEVGDFFHDGNVEGGGL